MVYAEAPELKLNVLSVVLADKEIDVGDAVLKPATSVGTPESQLVEVLKSELVVPVQLLVAAHAMFVMRHDKKTGIIRGQAFSMLKSITSQC
jgi:hypothetical protein